MTTSEAARQDRMAVIDLGSNTILLLVIDAQGRAIEEQSRITRLGQGVFRSGRLHPEAIARTRAAVADFAARARACGATRVVGVGTEALRRASDGAALLADFERSGLLDRARLLSGEEEALCSIEASRRAARAGAPVIVIDVGGGSTELAWVPSGPAEPVRGISLPLGSVRLTEAWLPRHPIPAEDLVRFRKALQRGTAALAPLRGEGLDARGREVVAVAGTATTLAALELALDPYDADRVEGFALGIEVVESWVERLAALDLDARRRMPGLEPGRADVIVAGIALLGAVMRAIGAREVRASGRGVRHGVALRMLEDPDFLR